MNIWKRYSMRVSKNWVKFNKMFTLSPWYIPLPRGGGHDEQKAGGIDVGQRRHLDHLFHPIVGDTTHGDGRHNRFFREHYGCDRLLLIAHRLSFEHPVLKVPMRIQAPLGPEVLGLFARLGWPASESDYGA